MNADAGPVIDVLTNKIAELTKELAVHQVVVMQLNAKVEELQTSSLSDEPDDS